MAFEIKSDMTFESALARLEQVVRQMESGNAPLDQTLALFEEGKALVAFCEKTLTDAEQRVLKVTANGDTVDFNAQ